MHGYITASGLKIAQPLYELVRDEIAPGTGIEPDAMWAELATIVADLGPTNQRLLDKRDQLQRQIDQWMQSRVGQLPDVNEQKQFLIDIGYLVDDHKPCSATTANVDPEIAEIAGPQLVVPVDNARYALNAANARWGSLYDALYGTNVIAEDDGAEIGSDYNPTRGSKVVAHAAEFLNQAGELKAGSHHQVTRYALATDGATRRLAITLEDGTETSLREPEQFVGYSENEGQLTGVLLRHNALHIEIQIDPQDPIGASHAAGVKDVVLESAVTTIQDCEDSVAAVDAEDKIGVYRNWAGIMKGTLTATLNKGGHAVERTLNPDRRYQGADGQPLTLPGRSLLLVRNVGAHMYTDAVTTLDDALIPEGFLDAMITCLAAKHDLLSNGAIRNTKTGSIYVVKPKQHGPEEVAATVELFERVEQALDLAAGTIKIGIMDEERRTTVNLDACIRAAQDRVIFINTGFLDRTGDEIHTLMEIGPVLPKAEIKSQPWMLAYEDWNVDAGLAAGLAGRAQIGKGMWAMPDEMQAMMETKGAHPKAGANCAWVPSPTAATLHAMHYHQTNVRQQQRELAKRERASLDDILRLPLLGTRQLAASEIQQEIDNNAQGILGYVVRWVNQGVGCSKVPDFNDVGLMEDRATLRISSQHLANWLRHGLIDKEQLLETFYKMAAVVDRQNENDVEYSTMAPDFDNSIAFQAALDLVFTGCQQPNGYTEPVLHARRRELKASLS